MMHKGDTRSLILPEHSSSLCMATITWLAILKKGLSEICVKCRLGSACAIRAG